MDFRNSIDFFPFHRCNPTLYGCTQRTVWDEIFVGGRRVYIAVNPFPKWIFVLCQHREISVITKTSASLCALPRFCFVLVSLLSDIWHSSSVHTSLREVCVQSKLSHTPQHLCSQWLNPYDPYSTYATQKFRRKRTWYTIYIYTRYTILLLKFIPQITC